MQFTTVLVQLALCASALAAAVPSRVYHTEGQCPSNQSRQCCDTNAQNCTPSYTASDSFSASSSSDGPARCTRSSFCCDFVDESGNGVNCTPCGRIVSFGN